MKQLRYQEETLAIFRAMRKDSLENLILAGRIEGKRDRGKQHINYLANLSKWMTSRFWREKKCIKSYKRQNIVESHDLLRPHGTQHIKEKEW